MPVVESFDRANFRGRAIRARGAASAIVAALLCAMTGCSESASTVADLPTARPPRGAALRSPDTPAPPVVEPPAPAPVEKPVPAATNGDPQVWTLADLSAFPYAPPKANLDDAGNKLPVGPWPDTVPKRIYDLEGRRVTVEGYVIGLDYADGAMSKFILAAFLPSCCFGDTIRPNQWIEVTMKNGERVEFQRGPNRATGVLRIVPHDSPDSATKLYVMTAEKLEGME